MKVDGLCVPLAFVGQLDADANDVHRDARTRPSGGVVRGRILSNDYALSIALVSPYAKADVRKRLFAATIDGIPVLITWLLYGDSGAPLFLVIGAGYLLLRESMRGQSLGKLLLGLVVISLETGRPCTLKGSVWRNVVFLIPGANMAAIFLEPITVVRDPQGQRLGDKLAQTQVVEGFGVRDLAASFQRWWRSFISELNPIVRKPGREAV